MKKSKHHDKNNKKMGSFSPMEDRYNKRDKGLEESEKFKKTATSYDKDVKTVLTPSKYEEPVCH